MNNPSFSLNAVIYFVGGLAAAGSNLLLAPMYLRMLSAKDYGTWSAFLLTLQFLMPLLCWGLLATMTRLMVERNEAERGQTIGAALKMATVFNALLLLVAVAASRSPHVSGPAQLLPYACAAAALAAYPQMLMGIHVAKGEALRYRGLSLIGFALQAAGLLAISALVEMDATVAVLTYIGAATAYAGLSIVQLVRLASWNTSSVEYKALLSFGVPVVLYTLAGQSSDFITRYVLAASVAAPDFGAFSAGLLYASVVAMLSSAVNLAWVPLYYRHADEWMANGVYHRFAELVAGSMAICGAFLILFSQELLAVYSGGNVSLGLPTVGALVISAWLNSAVWMALSNPLFQRKRARLLVLIAVIAASGSVPLGLALIHSHGVFGATLALLLNAILCCATAGAALRWLGIPGPNYQRLAVLLSMLVLIASPAMNFLQSPDTLHPLVTKSLLLATFIGISFFLSLRPGLHALRIIESGAIK